MSVLDSDHHVESTPRKRRELGRFGLVGSCLGLLVTTRCAFPDYDLLLPMNGGGTIAGGALGAGTSGASAGGAGASSAGASTTPQGGMTTAPSDGGGAGATAGEPSSGGESPLGGAPACAGEQWPSEHCPSECLVRYPAHCYDGDQSDGETGVDCGGDCQGCGNDACQQDADCLYGRCEPGRDGKLACRAPLTVALTPQDVNRYLGTANFRLEIRNVEPEDGADFALKDLKLRYYLASSGLVEPLLVQTPQANLMLAAGGSRTLPATSWVIEHVEALPDAQYDAYIEVSFAEAAHLYPGDGVQLFQQLSTGLTSQSNFDQFANYSFNDEPDQAWSHITLFHRGKLIWGLEPRPANPRACFARAVNLGGPALRIGESSWQAASEANLTTSGTPFTQSIAPYPSASGDLAILLGSATHLGVGNSLDWPVPNGTYLTYVYAISAGTEGSASLFSLQGSPPPASAGFRAQLVNGSGAWAKLGPYRVDVSSGKLSLAVTSGAINFAGLELWYPD